MSNKFPLMALVALVYWLFTTYKKTGAGNKGSEPMKPGPRPEREKAKYKEFDTLAHAFNIAKMKMDASHLRSDFPKSAQANEQLMKIK